MTLTALTCTTKRQEGERGRETLEKEGEEEQQGKDFFFFFLHIKTHLCNITNWVDHSQGKLKKEQGEF